MTHLPAKEEIEEEPFRGVPKLRRCLRCQVSFNSEWAGERICARCKNSNAWRSGIPVRSSNSGSGRR